MINLLESIHSLFPILGIIILFFGIQLRRKNYILVALWLSLIALILHYRASGGEILGSYFNYLHAAIYSLNLIVLISSIICLLLTSMDEIRSRILRYGAGLLSAGLITGGALLITNLWINASFVENRLPGTPILQVATFNKQPYCSYKYVFYKIGSDSIVRFMCPNHYGLLPSVGPLNTAPSFVIKQLPTQLQAKFQENSEAM
ncbi:MULTISPECIES: type I secretion system protein LssZ [Legionella]|uniref:Type I secretion system LssZ n=1 Tax=Legionella drozanskii LLAP-1 TaxID=1212489 RepID=A0A0W0TDX7_9GAMM|nr:MULTISPECIES: type I secretion system protein LssZ [Legionella]KTC93661.1 type I secretion system LssZ [Legionella drozanskii LLAP-1]